MRQEVQVTDNTMTIVSIYFWGEKANNSNLKTFDVVEFRNLRVNKFNEEICLNFGEESMIIHDSQVDEVVQLKTFLEEKRK